MFGIGFTEILLIAVVAILFLGPDKLPETMVQIAKFIKNVKQTISDAKSTFEEEIRVNELKEEALSYKRELDKATEELRGFKNIDFDEIVDDIVEIDERPKPTAPSPYADERPQTNETTEQVEPKMENVAIKKRERTFKTLDDAVNEDSGEDKA